MGKLPTEVQWGRINCAFSKVGQKRDIDISAHFLIFLSKVLIFVLNNSGISIFYFLICSSVDLQHLSLFVCFASLGVRLLYTPPHPEIHPYPSIPSHLKHHGATSVFDVLLLYSLLHELCWVVWDAFSCIADNIASTIHFHAYTLAYLYQKHQIQDLQICLFMPTHLLAKQLTKVV